MDEGGPQVTAHSHIADPSHYRCLAPRIISPFLPHHCKASVISRTSIPSSSRRPASLSRSLLSPSFPLSVFVSSVSWLDVARGETGCLGLCYCPGKNVVREGVRWARDLDTDLQRLIVTHGVHVVVCLLSDAELRALGVGRDYAARVQGAGLELIGSG